MTATEPRRERLAARLRLGPAVAGASLGGFMFRGELAAWLPAWRWMFPVYACFAAASFLLVRVALPETAHRPLEEVADAR